MKKLIVLIGALAVAIGLQAASVRWSTAAGTTYAGYSVYLTNAASYSSLEDLQNDLLGTSGNTGTLVAGTRSASANGEAKGLAENTSYDFYFVFVKGDDYWATAKQTATTAAETGTPPSIQLAAANGTTLLSGAKSGSFSGVPEPTSGLLLLFGVAGLALRRRRA